MGVNKDKRFDDIQKAIESPEYKHPKYLNTSLTPMILIKPEEIDKLSGKQAAREKISNFMSQVIYAPPIRNKNEKVLFTGGPMYKRAFASFSTKGGKTRSRRKHRNKSRKH